MLRKLESQHERESVSLGRLTHTDVFQIPLKAGMAAVGQRIRDLHLPPQVLIISVRREAEVLIPHGETLLQPGDTVVALTQPDVADELRRVLTRGEQGPKGPVDGDLAPARDAADGKDS